VKQTLLVAGIALALTSPAFAQWSDNFDSYAANQSLSNVGGWFGWDNVPAAAATVDGSRSRSFPNSLRVDPTTDAVRPQLGAVGGRWTLTAWQYIPSPQAGDLYFILNNVYNHGGPYSWTTQLKCSNGMVVDDMRTHTPRPIVYDQWVEFRAEIDLDANSVAYFYNGELVSQGTYASSGPVAIENLDLFSTGGTCYWDDISLAWRGDSFERYTAGQTLSDVGGWFGWDNVPSAAATVDTAQARSAPHSLRVDPTTDAVRPGIGLDGGRWTITAWQYIPSPQAGALYFIMNNVYNHGGPYSWTTQLKCLNGVVIDEIRAQHTPQPLVFDQWVEFRVDLDLDANTVAYYYNGALISQGTYAQSGPVALANIDLFSTGGTCYWDDFRIQAATTAPCYETDLGVALNMGDDSLSVQQLGFTFPFPGGSTTSIAICSNGFIWLDPTETSTDYSNSVAEFLGSLQSTPRIAPCWRDFNPTATGSDDVYFNAFPDRAVITWHQVTRYNGTVPMTVQCQLLADGSVYFYYAGDIDGTGGTAPEGRSLIGIKAATGQVSDPGNTDYTAALPVNTGAPVVYEFIGDSVNFDLRNRCIRFVPNPLGGYTVSFRADCGAAASPFGIGCPASAPVTLSASAPPVIGTTFDLDATNVPIGADAGAVLLGLGTMNVGLDFLGLTGCSAYTTMDLVMGLALSPPNGTVQVTVPTTSGLIGMAIHAQAAVVKNSPPMSTHTSNGLSLIFGKD